MVDEHYGQNPKFTNTLIVFGYNLNEAYETEVPLDKLIENEKARGVNIIVYQLEQLYKGSPWVNERSIRVLRLADEIWDYDLQNIEYLYNNFRITPKFRPMLYSQSVKSIPKIDFADRDIDVLFYGSVNERRSAVLTEIQKSISPKKIEYVPNIWGEELDELVSRAKIVLNIHYYPRVRQEQVRLFYLVSNGMCVVSEYSEHNYMGNSILNVPINDIPLVCSQLLASGKWINQSIKSPVNYKLLSDNYRKKIII